MSLDSGPSQPAHIDLRAGSGHLNYFLDGQRELLQGEHLPFTQRLCFSGVGVHFTGWPPAPLLFLLS